MNKIKVCSFVKISMSILIMGVAPTSYADPGYYLVVPIKGLKWPFTQDEKEQAWAGFAETKTLLHPADWSALQWSWKGLTEIPLEPYPNTDPTGYINLFGNSISDFSSLSSINTAGDLKIFNNPATSLKGLESLTSIGNRLRVDQMPNLNNISALSNLTSVGGRLFFQDNPLLEDVSPLQNITSIGDLIYFDNRQYTVRAPGDSPFCQWLQTGTTSVSNGYPISNVCNI